MEEKLKCCPVCHKIPQINTHDYYANFEHVINYTVDCSCGFAYPKKNSHNTKESAIIEWNNLVDDYVMNKEAKYEAWKNMALKAEIKHALEALQLNCDMQWTKYGDCGHCPVNTADNCRYDYSCLLLQDSIPATWDINELIKKGKINGST